MVEQRTLPPTPDSRLQAACAELDRRLRLGESRAAEAVLADFPEVAADPDSALQLVYEELVGRERLGEQPAYDEYYQRFPQWQVELRKSFDIHEALVRHGSGPGAATPPSNSARETESAKHQPATSRRYELLGEVGRGGMGVVYRARQPGLSRIVHDALPHSAKGVPSRHYTRRTLAVQAEGTWVAHPESSKGVVDAECSHALFSRPDPAAQMTRHGDLPVGDWHRT